MMRLLEKEDPICYTCRSYVKGFAINVPLLRAIVSFKNGYYLHLVLQLNDSANKQNEMMLAVTKLKEEYAGFDKLKETAEKRKEQLEAAQLLVANLTRNRDELFSQYNAAHRNEIRLDQAYSRATERLRATMSMNKVLFDEVIALRLHAVEVGTMARSQLGIEHPLDSRGDPEKVVLNIQSRDRKTTMYYGRKRKELSPEERGSVQRVEQYNDAEMDNLFADGRGLPDERDVRQSWIVLENGQPLIQMGSWLHERIMSKNNTAEATFDAPPVTEVSGPMHMYCTASKDALDSALTAYERLVAEAKEAAERPQEKAKEEAEAEEERRKLDTRLSAARNPREAINAIGGVIDEESQTSRVGKLWAKSANRKLRQSLSHKGSGEEGPSQMPGMPASDLAPEEIDAHFRLMYEAECTKHGLQPMPPQYYGGAVSPVQHVGYSSQTGISYVAHSPDAPREENYYQSLIDARAEEAAATDYSEPEPSHAHAASPADVARMRLQQEYAFIGHHQSGLEATNSAIEAAMAAYRSRQMGMAMGAPANAPLPPGTPIFIGRGVMGDTAPVRLTYPNAARYNRFWRPDIFGEEPVPEVAADDEQGVEAANDNDAERAPESVFDM